MTTTRGQLAVELDVVTHESLVAAGHLKWTKYGPECLGAFVAEMDFGTAPAITAALHDAVDRALFGYLPKAVTDDMAAACAAWHADRYGWPIDPSDVSPLPDVIKGMEVAIDHLSRPGSPVILPVPAYMPFLDVPSIHGRDTIQVPMVRDGSRHVYDLDALERAYAAGGDLLVLCNPHNPLGRVMERAELIAIAEVVERHGGRVFSDEIHAPLIYPGHRHVPYASISPATAGHTVTATSASKGWNLPGLKCGQLIVSNETDRERVAKLGTTISHGTSTLGALANAVAYRDGRDWFDAVLAYLDTNRHLLAELLAAHLPDIDYTPPEGTYLAWLDCRSLNLPMDVSAFFVDEAGVALIDGARCGPPGNGFVRLNFATSRPLLERIVIQMADAVVRRRRR